MRVNARLDKDLAAAMEQVLRKTGKTISQVMKEALGLYLEAQKQKPQRTIDVLRAAGVVGTAKGGPKDLSINAKRYLTEDLGRKHGHR